MLRVLALDDDQEYLEVLTAELERSGFEVSPVTTAPAALAELETGRFDALLLDLMMPEMSGEAVARQIRGRPQWEGLPIVLLTCVSDVGRISEGLLSGATYYVNKTAPVESLAELTRQVVSVARAGARRPDPA